MSDRLAELKRQRALAQEQLAWFDREIARESGQLPAAALPGTPLTPLTPAVPVSTIPVVDSAASAAAEAAAARAADEILAKYEKNPQNAAQDVKRGCYLWFAFGMGMLAIGTISVYVLYTYMR